jgi:hypothetical protein
MLKKTLRSSTMVSQFARNRAHICILETEMDHVAKEIIPLATPAATKEIYHYF